MKVVAILQARCSSRRLPNKVLLPILGKPMLQRQIERTLHSKLINELVVATSNQSSDTALVQLCEAINISCFAGDLDNVLDRFYQAALQANADVVVRLTGDCPLCDAAIIDSVIAQHISGNNDYTSNVDPETFPDGLDVEVMSFNALQNAWLNAESKTDLEHVTPYIRNQTRLIKGAVVSDIDYSDHRWTVDEPQDFEFVTKIYSILGAEEQYFDANAIYKLLLAQPALQEINTGIQRNEGFIKPSL